MARSPSRSCVLARGRAHPCTPDALVGSVFVQPAQLGPSTEKAPLRAVHYTCKLAASAEVLINTREESASGQPVRVVAGRGASWLELGKHCHTRRR